MATAVWQALTCLTATLSRHTLRKSPASIRISSARSQRTITLLGFESHSGPHSALSEDGQDDGSILAAIHYLEERYTGPLTIEELAGQTGYAPTYLTRKFRQRLGVSPTEYLLNLRIRHACTLLRDTNLSIASIACHVGFRDSQYFATRFHHVMGTTPSVFRAQSRTDSHMS